MDRQSSFKFYSIGIALADKERKSDLIKVMPLEEISQSTGAGQDTTIDGSRSVNDKVDKTQKNLNDQSAKYTVKIPDHQGIDRKEMLSGDVAIVAKWSAIGQSNRMTPPDIIAGESVMIYRIGDTGEYYWTSLMREPGVRRQETVCEMYGNIPNGQVAWDKDTSYWQEVSTHDKYWHLHTAKNDGEPFAYDIKIDTAKGVVSIDDNAGNNIILDSGLSKLTINTLIDVEVNTQNVVVNATVKAEVNTVNANIVASEALNVDAPNSFFSGNVTVGGGLSTGASGAADVVMNGNVKSVGDSKVTGSSSIDGDVTVSGSVTATGTVNGSNI